MIKTFLLLVGIGGLAFAQEGPFGIGVKGGVPFTDAISTNPVNAARFAEDTHRYTFGPYVELRLPAGFAVELDALYRTFEYQQIQPLVGRTVNAHTWEFPLLAKYRFLRGPIHPYVEGGVSFAHISARDITNFAHEDNYGVVLGAGIDFRLAAIHITPEIRYNNWVWHSFDSPVGAFHSNRNQAAFLLGIGF